MLLPFLVVRVWVGLVDLLARLVRVVDSLGRQEKKSLERGGGRGEDNKNIRDLDST